ncbi:hypothetical protein KAI58_04685 [Candidatus Gracilibacteria bacterium]|nr:hypothetical protein [Candidatus Gracilibacteria bacterium]
MEISPKDQAAAFIRRANKILCVTQEKTQGDGICSLLAAQMFLTRLGKEVFTIVPHGIEKPFKFLPGSDNTQTDLGDNGDFVISISTKSTEVERVKYTIEDESVDILVTPKTGHFSSSDVNFRQSAGNFDLVLVFDSPNLESLGFLFENHVEIFSTVPIINVSANPANEYFGKINIVEPQKSSTSEILFDFIRENDSFASLLDEKLATILLSGIIESTGSFLENSTTAHSLEAASRLQNLGANQSDIIENIFKKKSLKTLKSWGRVLGNLQVDPVHKITWSNVSKADFEISESVPEDIENISGNLLRFVQNIDLAVLLIEYPERTVIQMRSANLGLNFAELRAIFGGEIVKNGLNIEVPKKNVAEIEGDFLRLLLKFQKKRLGISEDIGLQKVELMPKEEVSPKQTNFAQVSEDFSKSVKPTPPSQIPFIAPFQPHESVEKVEKEKNENIPPGTRSAEVMIDPNNSEIPDWLKKNLPKMGE